MQQVPKCKRLATAKFLNGLHGPPRPKLQRALLERVGDPLVEAVCGFRDPATPVVRGRRGGVSHEGLRKHTLDDTADRLRDVSKLEAFYPTVLMNVPRIGMRALQPSINPIEIVIISDDTRQRRQLRRRGRALE